jgi:peptide/nickel transport system permease protein
MAAAASITVVFIPQYFRVVRAEVVRVKTEAFVESAKVIGASTPRIMFRHVLRNSTRTLPLIVTLNASEAIATLAALGFLGFGIQPTAAAEWGYDLNKSISDVAAGIWWTAIPRARDRADGAGHHPHRREPQRPRRPAPARAAPRGSAKKTPTPADAVAASQPASRESWERWSDGCGLFRRTRRRHPRPGRHLRDRRRRRTPCAV